MSETDFRSATEVLADVESSIDHLDDRVATLCSMVRRLERTMAAAAIMACPSRSCWGEDDLQLASEVIKRALA